MLLFPKIDLLPRGRRSRAHGTISPCQDVIKRGFDIVVAIAGLLLLSPLTLIISLAIKSASPGPVVRRHTRYGVYNETFELLEFRTTLAREEEETFTFARRFGQLLRRTGIDKSPQLVNVLRGEMSIVGPHPFATAPGMVFHLPELHKVKPGLVSWAQVIDDLGETANSVNRFERRLEYDRYYLENRSLSFDMEILFLTLLSQRTYL
jgi:lipopolysaccharide/colanic/teichoic acid biosynthesis glycosyltransferase